MGDPSGIGPEVILKALADPVVSKVSRPLILGDWGVLQRARKGRSKFPKLVCWQPGQQLLPMLDDPSAHVVCSLSALSARDSRPGKPARIAGHGAFSYIRVAAKLALSKVVDGIATAPISKSILIDAGYNYPGHTELLAELSRTPECRMMLMGAKLRVVPVTGHVAFTKVARNLTRDNIQTTLELTQRGLKDFFGIARPRIAVAALNPHGGEEGIFGNEEIEVIAPAVRQEFPQAYQARAKLPASEHRQHSSPP
jgi:Pyridoxal phosphate biosynthesis protein